VWLGHTGIESGVSSFGIALVQVPLCSFNAVSKLFVWAITSAEFSVRMKCPPSVCDLPATRLWVSGIWALFGAR
jgi:hypothetical protein